MRSKGLLGLGFLWQNPSTGILQLEQCLWKGDPPGTGSKRLPRPDTPCGGQAYQCPAVAQVSLGAGGKSLVHKDKDAFQVMLLVVAVPLLSFLSIHLGVSLWEKGVWACRLSRPRYLVWQNLLPRGDREYFQAGSLLRGEGHLLCSVL